MNDPQQTQPQVGYQEQPQMQPGATANVEDKGVNFEGNNNQQKRTWKYGLFDCLAVPELSE